VDPTGADKTMGALIDEEDDLSGPPPLPASAAPARARAPTSDATGAILFSIPGLLSVRLREADRQSLGCP
jgi:hypothetical protein